MSNFSIRSESFGNGESIPSRFTCEGENINPPLTIAGVPEDAKSLALLVTDPDIPDEVKNNMGIEVFDHWIAFNIGAEKFKGGKLTIESGSAPGTLGVNSAGEIGYTGPCPPAEYEPTEHRYTFSVYALDTRLDVSPQASKEAVMRAMKGHIIDRSEHVGKYEKQKA